MQLVIGNKNYSSGSMRPWLLLRHFGVPFVEIDIALFTDGYQHELAQYSPTLRVPVLKEGDNTIWDSLAICEYVSENIYKALLCPQIFRSAPYAVLIVARCILASWLYVPRCL